MAPPSPKRRGRRGPDDPLEAYRRVRKPMPPPERVLPDRRREVESDAAEQEIEEALSVVSAKPTAADPQGDSPNPFRAPHPSSFRDREEAGAYLAEALRPILPLDAVILAIPRGGVEIGAVIAERLRLPLDIVIPRKLGAPNNPELGLGAVAEGVRVLDERLVRTLNVPTSYLEAEIERQEEEIRRRTAAYRAGRGPVPVGERTAVVVDDGVATGGTAVAAIRWAKKTAAREVVFAAPVAPVEAVRRLEQEADGVVVLSTPPHFYAVGQWYVDFPQVSDTRVVWLLRGAAGRADA
jgi:putative phosphoribosyl transferase